MLNHIIIRLVAHYFLWSAVFVGLFYLFPVMLDYIIEERYRIFTGGPGSPEAAIPPPPPPADFTSGMLAELDPARIVPVVIALVLSFVLTLPLAWVYGWTRSAGKYSQSFAHTLLVIPVAIALVVFLVKGSLALAFSLAGIVAAVRFRSALKQPMDAVYMFMAIGIGLAAATQLIVIAWVASVMFAIIALGVWKTNFGATPAVVSGWRIVRPGEGEPTAGGRIGSGPPP